MPKPRIVVIGDSEQAVALGLLRLLMRQEDAPRGRAALLAAYRECLEAVRGTAPLPPPLPLPPEEALPDEEDEPSGEEDAAPHPPAPPRRRKPRRRG